MNMKGQSKTYMHRILSIEQSDEYIQRRDQTRAVDAARPGQKRTRDDAPPCQGWLEEKVGSQPSRGKGCEKSESAPQSTY